MKFRSLDLKLFAIVIVICSLMGLITGLWIGSVEEKSMIKKYSNALGSHSNYYASQIQEDIDDRTKAGVEANHIIKKVLTSPRIKTNSIKMERGQDGAVRMKFGEAAVFLSSRKPLTDEVLWQTQELQKIWQTLYPMISLNFQSYYVILGDGYIFETPTEWASMVEADHDFTKDLFYYLADPIHNPKREPVWTPVYYDSFQKKWMISLIVPLYFDDRFAGVTGSDYNIDNLFKTVMEMNREENWSDAFIFDSQGNIIIHPDYMKEITDKQTTYNSLLDSKELNNPGLEEFINRVLNTKDVSLEVFAFTDRGKKHYAGVRPIKGLASTWYLVIYCNADTILAELNETKKKILLTSVFTAVILGLLLRFAFHNLVTKRIAELATASEKIGEGKWDVSLPPDSPDEIGALIKAFKSMSGEIQSLVTNLEQRVKDRTMALRESEERIRLLLESASDGILGVDLSGNITFVNPMALKMLGYSAEDLIGRSIRERILLTDDDGNPFSWEDITCTTDPGDREVSDKILLRSDGSSFPVDLTCAPIKKDGSVAGHVILFRDITERKKAEQAERENQQRLQTVVDSVQAIIVMKDREGRYILVNRFFEDAFGIDKREVIGKTASEIFDKDSAEAITRLDEQVLKTGKSSTAKQEIRHSDGTSHIYLITQVPLKDKFDKIYGLCSAATDITEIIQLQEELRKAKDIADEANRAKSEFLARMSHEIRTPMNAIIGMSHLTLKTDLSPKQRDYIAKVYQSAHSLLGIINDILDFSKIEAGKLTIESIDFDIEDVLEKVANLIALKAEEKGLELLFKRDPDVPDILVGDPLRLGQILINLTNNAVKFTEKGEIVVSTSVLCKDEKQVKLKFSVKDTGIGLTSQQMEKLFQSFSQADGSTTRKYGGTGLGLAICKRLVELMGGKIWVESKYGKGSEFIFTAIFGYGFQKKTSRLILSQDLRGARALVVDDSKTAREILTSALNSFGFEVSEASSGEEALLEIEKLPAEKHYELVLMDWKMPGMNGVETTQKIKEKLGINAPKIILITAYGREEIFKSAQDAGIDAFLMKPVNNSILFDAIISVLGDEIPERRKKDSTVEIDLETLQPIQGAHVLIVEDNEINQQVASEILKDAGLIVSVANNGKEAIEAVEQGNYDLILMDIQMPEMDGLEATRHIRASKKEDVKTIPIIAMTANAMDRDRKISIEAGMNDYISKPIDPNQLFSILMKWIKPIEQVVNGHTHSISRPISEEMPPKKKMEMWAEKVQELGLQKPRYSGLPMSAEIIKMTPELVEKKDTLTFDASSGIKRLGENIKLYRELLHLFIRDNANVHRQIVCALENGDHKLAAQLAHTVKGTSGNIGAKELFHMADKLERAIKTDNQNETYTLLISFKDLIDKTINEINLFLKDRLDEEKTEGVKPSGDSILLRELLTELQGYAKKQKPKQCKEILSKIAGYSWDEEYSGEITSITSSLERYKFKDAQSIIMQLLSKIG